MLLRSLPKLKFLKHASIKIYHRNVKTLAFDQTLISTHPHLYGHGKHKGISKEEYRDRRLKLCEQIRAQNKNSSHIIIVPSQRVHYRSYDVPFKFHQDTNFLYLSGYKLPNAILILSIINNTINSTLFIKETSKETELWEGPSSNKENLTEILGIVKIENISEVKGYLNAFKSKSSQYNIWCKLNGQNLQHYSTEVSQFISDNQSIVSDVQSVDPYIQNLRLIKSPAEQDLLAKSCQIACKAITETIKFSHPMVQESLLEAKFDFESRVEFASGLAYPPVVAGGERACTIHYIANNQVIDPGQMVLMDAGCEYQDYCSDITRTWPVTGKFSKYQAMVYEALLDVQIQCIKRCQPHDMSLNALLSFMYSAMVKNFEDIGIIPANIPQSENLKLCPHHVGHHLGLDIHDCSTVSRKEPLLPGMVVTVEPGFYVPLSDAYFPAEFHGIGIRIEDDVLITDKESPQVLTHACPKNVKEIEALFTS